MRANNYQAQFSLPISHTRIVLVRLYMNNRPKFLLLQQIQVQRTPAHGVRILKWWPRRRQFVNLVEIKHSIALNLARYLHSFFTNLQLDRAPGNKWASSAENAPLNHRAYLGAGTSKAIQRSDWPVRLAVIGLVTCYLKSETRILPA